MDYKDAGVDIEGSDQAIEEVKALIESTYTEHVIAGVGPFGAIFDFVSAAKNLKNPVLVQSTDGVGTKLSIAQDMHIPWVCGIDIVNHCINDILCQGAKPLVFMDYIGQNKLRPEEFRAIIGGMVEACKEAGIALIGGETAQMPGVYTENSAEVVGCITGVVEEERIITGANIKKGDILVGLPSTGLHTNGYTLARKICAERLGGTPECWNQIVPDFNEPIGEVLLRPHKSYLKTVTALLDAGIPAHGIVHITGGGLPGNVRRILPENCTARIRLRSWPVLPIFQFLQQIGEISTKEMYRVFNMGIGLVLVVPEEIIPGVFRMLREHNEPAYQIGEITRGKRNAVLYIDENRD